METEKNYLEQNISRLLRQANQSVEPAPAFKEFLINSALHELGRPETGRGLSIAAGIDRIMKVAAMIAIVCGAIFELLISGIACMNASFASAVFVAMIVNGLTYLGGLIL